MASRDPRVDAYIAKSADFAKPILTRIREIVHETCPDVEENIKWGMPAFDYRGMMCGMAAFKAHCTLGFWKGSLIFEGKRDMDGMGQFGKLASVSDLPPKKELAQYIRKAMKLNEEGIKVERAKKPPKPEIPVPADLRAALKKNKKAQGAFDSFSPSHRREYLEWITEAKTDATREKRLATAVEWMAEGKSRNWKYER
ncbi:MAG TPA: YdeI/OmpD-associated family protein [Gemmatimonadaceae bacterium]